MSVTEADDFGDNEWQIYRGCLVLLPTTMSTAETGALRDAIETKGDSRPIIWDLSHCGFMDSAGLGLLISTIRRSRETGLPTSVLAAREPVARLLETTGFDRIVETGTSLDEIVDGFDEQ